MKNSRTKEPQTLRAKWGLYTNTLQTLKLRVTEYKTEVALKYKKLIITAVVIALLFSVYAFESVRAASFKIEVVSISPEDPVADVKQHVTVTLRLSRNGEPVQGHTLYALALSGGTFRGNRAITDENGFAVYTYVPYTATRLMPAMPVEINVADESNSVIMEVNAKFTFYINLREKD